MFQAFRLVDFLIWTNSTYSLAKTSIALAHLRCGFTEKMAVQLKEPLNSTARMKLSRL